MDRTEWHKIVVWGEQAELVQQFLHKGSHALIEGRIQSREWQDKEGQKRTSFEIVAISFLALDRSRNGDGKAVESATSKQPYETTDADIPF